VTPKERRDRLFKSSRPFIRSLQIYDQGNYHKDVGVLWVAHKRRPFYSLKSSLTQEQFAQEISTIAQRSELLIVEDENRQHKAVALIGIGSNGWKIEPHVSFSNGRTLRIFCEPLSRFFKWSAIERSEHVSFSVYKTQSNSSTNVAPMVF
jgi:hypothetical protein